MRVWFAPVLAVFALTGCGVFSDHSGTPAKVTGGQLSIMVVPQEDLGAAYAGLRIDGSGSGPQGARDVADDTVDPKDNAASVRLAGWEDGYSLSYADSKLKALIRRTGVESVSTAVDSFATEGAAREFILDQVGDLRRFNGRKVGGVKLRGVTPFDAEVGDEAWGVEFTFSVNGLTGHATVVQFRHGRLVGTSVFARGDDEVVRVEAVRLAQKLDERMRRVLAGELHASAVPVPKAKAKAHKAGNGALDPKRFTLTAGDLPRGTVVAGGGYRKHGDVRRICASFGFPVDTSAPFASSTFGR